MRKETFLKTVVAGISSAALAIALIGCAHHAATADGYGQVRTESPAPADAGATVGTTSAPNNTAGVATSPTPAVISGPAVVDNSGRAYTSSAAGGNGNGASLGNNTNVNVIPKQTNGEVTVTQSPATLETPVAAVETPAPAIVETPAPAPVVETPAPMASAVEQTPPATTEPTPEPTPTKHHRKMHKD